MTKTGRIVLFVNLALSMVFAFWGFGVYSNQVNWTNQKIGEREGEFTKRQEEINREKDARTLAEGRWDAALKALLTQEAKRPELQKWYAQQLQNLQTGKPTTLQFAKGELQVDRAGFPALAPVPNLDNIKNLNTQYDETLRQIQQVTKEIDNLVEEEKKLTEKLGKGDPASGGLRYQLAEEQRVERNSESEQNYLKTPLYNAKSEAQSLIDRRRVLEARLKELQGVADNRPP